MDAGASPKKLVRVTIFQQPITISVSGEPGETEALAREVDEIMNRIAARAPGADPVRIAVLACLHFADKARLLEHDLSALRQSISDLDRRIAADLGEAVAPPPASE